MQNGNPRRGWPANFFTTGSNVSRVESTPVASKTYLALFYEVVSDYIDRRAGFREEHLALARAAHQRGELVMAGAFSEPADGALLVWATGDEEVVRRFVEQDPYVREGLVTRWWTRPWTVVIGNP